MSYKEAQGWLFMQLPMFQRLGPKAMKYDLKNIKLLLDYLGNPHLELTAIHIAGTNGKGSVAHMLGSVYQQQGFKTGIYTSPHYKDYRERIKINGEMISKSFVTKFVTKVEQISEKIKPSYFEISVAMAFSWFKNQGVQISIVETGLGGRLDSTNMLIPILSIITNIGKDHTAFLGEKAAERASEKAGIIKSGVPVVIGKRNQETDQVFIEHAEALDAPIIFAEDIIEFDLARNSIDSLVARAVDFEEGIGELYSLDISGLYQVENLRTTLVALKTVSKYATEFKVTKPNIKIGLASIRRNTGFIGRMTVLSKKPLVIADSGHNKEGVASMLKTIQQIPHDKLHVVFGTVGDKDIGDVLKQMPGKAKYYYAKANIPRGKDAELLKKEAKQYGLKGNSYSTVKRALSAAKKSAKDEALILVCGSIFVVAEVL